MDDHRSTPFSTGERTALEALHQRYAGDRGYFTDEERAKFRFVKWLWDVGKLKS